MKRIVTMIMILALAISGAAIAKDGKQREPSGKVKGGGYYDGKFHGHKEGAPKKKLLRWDGFNNPIKGMKESAHKPPSTTPSQSPNP